MIKQATFIKSAASKEGWINDDIKEILFVGRSNVGKSSFINSITNQNKIAKVANTPGKTRLLNFFEINKGQYRIVDAPGYGYARISDAMKIQFGEMMEEFLTTRENLKAVCMLVDLRHKPTKDDIEMYNFLKSVDLPVILVATKLDKLKKNDINKNEKLIKAELSFANNEDYFIKVSNLNRGTVQPFYEIIDKILELKESEIIN